jgi:hypothetical protein
MQGKNFLALLVTSLAGTFCSTLIKSRVDAQFSDILGCENSCSVAAAGWPFPFIIDYPGLSPSGVADFLGLILGMDTVRFESLIGTFLFWVASTVGVTVCIKWLRSWPHRKKP